MAKNRIRCAFTTFVLACIFLNSAAQDKSVNGIVTTFDSIALVGASIRVKSSKQVTITDSLGNFKISCKPEDIIMVSARGYYTQRVKLTPGIKLAAINLRMKSGDKNREYAIGYGKVSERDKLYAISNLNSQSTDFSSYTSIYDLVQGRFAGVMVKNNEIIIRGTKSFIGGNAALIILNGIPVDGRTLASISPSEVKSIDILKDGSRGANGVVIIETK
jgi:hypothetical protein